MGVHIFTKIKNTGVWKKKKNVFFSYLISGISDFSIWAFSENAQCFIGAFLLTRKYAKIIWPDNIPVYNKHAAILLKNNITI